jgi:hypothetical protein
MRPKVLTSVAYPHHCDANPDLDPHHCDANPDLDPALHFDADADPDPALHCDAEPDPSIRILLFIFDPIFQFDADPYPAPYQSKNPPAPTHLPPPPPRGVPARGPGGGGLKVNSPIPTAQQRIPSL